MCISIPPNKKDVTQFQFLSRLIYLKFRVFLSHRLVGIPRLKSLVYSTIYSSLEGKWLAAYFPQVQCDMETTSSRTRFPVSMSYDDNHYTTNASNICHMYMNFIYFEFQLRPLWTVIN